MSDEPVAVDDPREGVRRLRLNRPEVRNAVNVDMLDALDGAFSGPDVRAVVLSSADPRGLCSGVDLSMDATARAACSNRLYEIYRQMLSSPAPIVCVLRGVAVGAGVQLALASDLRIGDATTRLRFAGPAHGLAVGAWGLPSLVGRGRAVELCLGLATVDGEEAARIGLVERIVDDPDEDALDLAEAYARLDPGAASAVKRLIVDGHGLVDGLEAERARNVEAWSGSIDGLEWSARRTDVAADD